MASFISALAPNGDILLASRILQALGGSMIFGNVYSLIASAFPGKEKAWALSLTVAVAYIGLSIGPVLGGFLTGFFGWRSIFFFSIPFGIAAIIAVFELKREWTEAEQDRFSISSTVVFALALIGIIYGFSEITSNTGIIVFIGGSVGGCNIRLTPEEGGKSIDRS